MCVCLCVCVCVCTRPICVHFLQGLQYATHSIVYERHRLGAPWDREPRLRHSGCVIQDGLELTTLLQPSNCGHHRHASLCLPSQAMCFLELWCYTASEQNICLSPHGPGQWDKRTRTRNRGAHVVFDVSKMGASVPSVALSSACGEGGQTNSCGQKIFKCTQAQIHRHTHSQQQ